MLHLFDQVRPPIDNFEATLVNAFSAVPSVQAVWVREVQQPATSTPNWKPLLRSVWLQLHRRHRGDMRQIEALVAELQVRVLHANFTLEVRWLLDELPPADVAPSCIFRRGSGRV